MALLMQGMRQELTGYLTRLVIRPSVAQELFQATAVRALEALNSAPKAEAELRPWLFRIATNLGIDELRRHGAWREELMLDARKAAESSTSFMDGLADYRGNPETAAVAREHLAICFSCTLGQLPPEHGAALLLTEVYGFGVQETADVMQARFAQVKYFIQQARAAMQKKYAATCALIAKQGVCYQCVELDGFFAANQGNPLAGTAADEVDARLAVLKSLRSHPPGVWHHRLMVIFDELSA